MIIIAQKSPHRNSANFVLTHLLGENVHRRRIRGSVCTGAHPSQQKRDAFASLRVRWIFDINKLAGNSASLRDSHALRLVSELPDLRAANVHRRRIRGSVRTGATPSQQKRHPCGCLFCWLGWPDLNRRMPESKSGALPLGDIPIFCQKVLYHRSLSLSRIFYLTLSFTFICSAPLIFKKRLRKVEFCGIL